MDDELGALFNAFNVCICMPYIFAAIRTAHTHTHHAHTNHTHTHAGALFNELDADGGGAIECAELIG